MKKLLLAVSLILMTSFVNAQYLVSATELLSKNGSQIKNILNYWGWETDTMTFNGAVMYKITYNTTDVFGEPTVASGALFVPLISCDTLPFVSYQHGTEFEKIAVPSNTYGYTTGLFFSGNGYIATMPDYLGMGDNPGLHPYVHWESEATASIDLIRAAREYLNDILLIRDNNQLFIVGYSQGGHATMAIHKYITVNNLQNEFNVIASAPLSGVYPIYDVQWPEMFDEDSSYYAAEFLPYGMASYQMVYGNLYDNYDEYYDPPYDSIIADWLISGIHTGYEWNQLIPDNFYDFMQDSVLDNIKSNPDHPWNVDMRENDLHNWIPQEPVRMLYCGMDSMAFPENSIMARDTMNAMGAPDVQAMDLDPNGTHETCFLCNIYYALEWFDSLAAPGIMVGISMPTDIKQHEISLYPNPFSLSITIEYELSKPSTADITIFNHLGQIVERISLGNSQPGIYQFVWKASRMPAGIYFVQVRAGQKATTRKIVKMR